MDKQADTQVYRHIAKADRYTVRQTNRQKNKHAHGQTGRKTCRQTDTQTRHFKVSKTRYKEYLTPITNYLIK